MVNVFFRLFLFCCAVFSAQAACTAKGVSASGITVQKIPVQEERSFRDLKPLERAERMMKAFAEGYPQAIQKAEFRKGDWAVLMKGRWFYYADGRLLPEELLNKKNEYAPQSFYSYAPELPEWKKPDEETAERLKKVLGNRRANPPKRSPDFFDTLWDAHNKTESGANLATVQFLGKTLSVHKGIREQIEKVEKRILDAAKTDPAVGEWINGIGSIGAWNWRNVAATVSRSFHAYATALDIQPKSLRGLQTYWQWTADKGVEWYNVPYSGRFHPPGAVIKAFEAYGFCWGGKWVLFDTMHFEYRPEIFLMHNMTLEK